MPTGLKGFQKNHSSFVIPDFIAIKDNKVFAVEVEYNKPRYEKYTDDIRKYYDDVIWILRNKK